MINTTIQYNIIIIIIAASALASTRPDPRGRGRGQDSRGRGHKILASRGLEAEARPRGLTSLHIASRTTSCTTPYGIAHDVVGDTGVAVTIAVADDVVGDASRLLTTY